MANDESVSGSFVPDPWAAISMASQRTFATMVLDAQFVQKRHFHVDGLSKTIDQDTRRFGCDRTKFFGE